MSKVLAALNAAIEAANDPEFNAVESLQAVKDVLQNEQRDKAIAAAYARNDVEAAARMLNGGDLE